ncbi:MAG TPA: hypothetical protein VGF30_02385 [Bacteroidia bacterium]
MILTKHYPGSLLQKFIILAVPQSGITGLLCAFFITGISVLYFGWRESISTIEILIPLIGILPTVKLYDFLNKKYPAKSKPGSEAKIS